MKTVTLSFLILFELFLFQVNAQEILTSTLKHQLKLTSDNSISSAIKSTDGYFYTTGYTYNNSKGGKDIWIAKFSIDGKLIWEQTFGDINNDEGTALIESISGDIAIVGHSINSTSGYTEGVFLKFDVNGKLLAQSSYKISPFIKLYDIKVFDKKTFVISGVRKEMGDDDLNFVVMKVNDKGVKLWQQQLGTKYFTDEAMCLMVTPQQEILAAGYTTNEKKLQQIYLVKLDSYGKIIFDEKLGSESEQNNILAISETPDNKVLLAGYTTLESNGAEDMLVILYDKQKKTITKKSFGKQNSDKLTSIQPYKGGYLAIGTSKSLKEENEYLYVVKLNKELEVEWEKTLVEAQSTIGNDLVTDLDGFSIFGSIKNSDVENALIVSFKDNSSSLSPEDLASLSSKSEYSLFSNVVTEEFDDVTYRGSGDPLKGLNVSKSLDDLKIGNYYALIIGIDKYSGSWTPLKNAVNDAKAIETLLKSKYKFHQFKSLYNETATRENIISALEWLVTNVKPEDNVFIYYSGHGEFKKELNKGYWVPYGATTMSTSNYISNSDIQTFIKGIQSQHTLLVADACFSGDIFRGNTISVPFENSPKYFKKVHSLKSRQAMTSGGIEPVMDGGKDGHSVFAYYLLKALKENNSEMMDASQIYGALKIPVYNNSDQSPDFKPISKSGDEGGQFIFMKK
ncbi:MAG: caspase family protein [Flavobacteriales bacterium]|nr:caspase family protein [Flavobacteriales bacterium]